MKVAWPLTRFDLRRRCARKLGLDRHPVGLGTCRDKTGTRQQAERSGQTTNADSPSAYPDPAVFSPGRRELVAMAAFAGRAGLANERLGGASSKSKAVREKGNLINAAGAVPPSLKLQSF